ncbi:MAG: ABC transporter ATP-binding protein [Sphingobacteriales bacterium]|nr:ABC transporter ATP-binding protein [Sphingobacteriales bacterium]
MPSLRAAIRKLFQLINLEKIEIQHIYIYAIISGVIMLSLPLGIQAIINLMFGAVISTSLVVLIILVIMGTLFNGILQVKQMRITERIQQRIFTRLTFEYTNRIPKLKLQSLDDYHLPELVNRFFDTVNLQKGLSKLILDFPVASIQIVFGLILLAFYHPVFIAFGMLLSGLVYSIFYYTSPKGFSSSIRESDYKYHVAHWLEEIGRSVKTFKFFQHNDLHLNKTDELVSGYLKARDEHFSVLVFQYRVMIAFKVLITGAMLIIGAVLFINQQINLGQFIAAEIIIITIINAVEKMIVSLETVYDVLTSLEKINKILDKPQDLDVERNLITEIDKNKGLEIELRDVSFGFQPDKKILKNINLTIKSGEKICIRGEEGSGKTTLLRFLSGMWSDFEGNLLYNQIPFKNYNPDKIYEQTAFFLDEDELFSGTIIENITLKKEISDYKKLKDVCDLVSLSDFLNNNSQGLDYHIDPQGKRLSSSIAKKILLARCFYKEPQLLLLEDGWLAIEKLNRERIIDFLTAKNQKFTLVLISDEQILFDQCDRVLTMKDGQILN